MTDMTDASPSAGLIDFDSPQAAARLKKRYRSEARFRFYGLAAIGFAALFLVLLLGDILLKGLPAFTVHKANLSVELKADEFDPEGTGDAAVIERGNFIKPVRKAVRAYFPWVKKRGERRKLNDIMSPGAADQLRLMATADTALIGQSLTVPLLFSDDADLYFKGLVSKQTRTQGSGNLVLSATSGEIDFSIDQDAFRAELDAVKAALSAQLAGLERQARRLNLRQQQTGAQIETIRSQLEAGGNDNRPALEEQLAKLQQDAASLAAALGKLSPKQEALTARVSTRNNAETLDEALSSHFIAVNGGLIKITQLGLNGGKGIVLLPPAEATASIWQKRVLARPQSNRRLSDLQIAWLEKLNDEGLVKREFNWGFFSSGDSREAELAGVRGGMIGSALVLVVTLLLSLPIGVAAAVYLQEFAPRNRATDIIEVSINNLAAVPSIVFGLLGLAVLLNFFGLPRSSALLGGVVLALMTLPTIIIAARASLGAVPPSIREGALGVGASHQQAVFHHVLPLAMPGILTGTIIGMARALGETAPLLLIGMVAFIVDVPSGFNDAATVLPVQIFLWSDLPEVSFQMKTAAAIIVLLGFLFFMNATAVILRKRFERRW